MSLQAQPIPSIPDLTAKIARRAFRKGNVYMQMRDVLGTFFTDDHFADLYPADGQPAYAPWRLALVSVMQFAENLTDRQAADAVRSRIDWKYALSLELTDEGFDFSVLYGFGGNYRESACPRDGACEEDTRSRPRAPGVALNLILGQAFTSSEARPVEPLAPGQRSP